MIPAWRPMGPADIDAVLAIAALVHPAFPERREVFADRLRLFPEGCLVLTLPGAPVGYAIGHPGRFGHSVALDTELGRLPEPADTFSVHAVALLEQARGLGAAGLVVELFAKAARTCGIDNLSLVAVNGAEAAWQRHGFAARPDIVSPEKLASYGEGAVFMVCPLT